MVHAMNATARNQVGWTVKSIPRIRPIFIDDIMQSVPVTFNRQSLLQSSMSQPATLLARAIHRPKVGIPPYLTIHVNVQETLPPGKSARDGFSIATY